MIVSFLLLTVGKPFAAGVFFTFRSWFSLNRHACESRVELQSHGQLWTEPSADARLKKALLNNVKRCKELNDSLTDDQTDHHVDGPNMQILPVMAAVAVRKKVVSIGQFSSSFCF